MQKLESRGLVLFNRNYRENDKLVKIFTEQAGKRMFFVRGGGGGKIGRASCRERVSSPV